MHGNETHVRVFDIATLYYTTSSKLTTADLPLAPTPTAVLDKTSGWLTGLSETTQYSLDGGKTWIFAGGTSVLLDLKKMNTTEILMKDIGTAGTAPSHVQSIAIEAEETVTPPATKPSAPSEPTDIPNEPQKPTVSAIAIAAIAIASAIAAGAVAYTVYYLLKKKF